MGRTEGDETLEDTIIISVLAANKSISDAWNEVASEGPMTQKADFAIRLEMLYFFLHMMARYAFEISQEARAKLQDELVPRTIQRLIGTSFDRSRVKKGVNFKALDADMVNNALDDFNEAEIDYSSCKSLGVEDRSTNEETVLGKLAARINLLTVKGYNPEFRLLIWLTAVESLAKSRLKEQVRKLVETG